MTPEQPSAQSQQSTVTDQPEEKSFLRVIVHSFFIIPFLIAVFCAILFGAMHLLTRESRSAYDYLEDIKVGGQEKRWQSAFVLSRINDTDRYREAFELAKILADKDSIPKDDQFNTDLIAAFERSEHDDQRVRQYLALAMGRSGRAVFVQPLIDALKDEKDENLWAVLYALGMLEQPEAAGTLYKYLTHDSPRIRSIAVVAVGNLKIPASAELLTNALNDPEANVQWGAAVSLAQLGNNSGTEILTHILDRDYLESFEYVDTQEAKQLMLTAIQAAGYLNEPLLDQNIKLLASSDKNMDVRNAAMAHTNR